MKEMQYQYNWLSPPEVLEAGTHNGYNFFVLNLGTHPCAYVEIPETDKNFGKDYGDINVDCHGGLTYSSKQLVTVDHDGWFVGWDYAHWGDYTGNIIGSPDEERHTTQEMVNECKSVVDQLVQPEATP